MYGYCRSVNTYKKIIFIIFSKNDEKIVKHMRLMKNKGCYWHTNICKMIVTVGKLYKKVSKNDSIRFTNVGRTDN